MLFRNSGIESLVIFACCLAVVEACCDLLCGIKIAYWYSYNTAAELYSACCVIRLVEQTRD